LVTGIFKGSHEALILEHYPAHAGNNLDMLTALITDYLFLCDSRQTVRLAESKASLAETYLFQFGQVPPCFWPPNQRFCCDKCCYGDELPFVFHDSGGIFPWNLTGADLAVANAASAYWISFAHTGDPSARRWPGTPAWPVYRTASDQSISLKAPLSVVSGLQAQRCDMWDQVGYSHAVKRRIAGRRKR